MSDNRRTVYAPLALRARPANTQAEMALLGALLANNAAAYERVSEFLKPEHFADPINGRIFRAIARRIEAGQLADAVTLKAEFEHDGVLEEVGGVAYLSQLLSAMVGIINAGEYGRALLDCWIRRELLDACGEAIEQCFVPPDAGAPAVIERLEWRLTRIAEGLGDTSPAIAFGDAVGQAIAEARIAAKRAEPLAGISTGYGALDRMTTGLIPGAYVVLAARPSMGKTGVGLGVAARAAARGSRVLFWSGEMTATQLGARAAAAHAWLSTVSVFTGRGYDLPADADRRTARELEPYEWGDLEQAEAAARRLPLQIDERPGITVQALRARARRLKRTTGLDLLVIDYLGLMRGSDETRRFSSRYDEITEISASLKALGKELRIPLLVLVQLNRGPEQREDKRPTLADLRDSGAIEQDADVVMFLYRQHYYLSRQGRLEPRGNEDSDHFADRQRLAFERLEKAEGVAEIIMAKNRHGPTGITRLRFVDRTTWFFDETEPDLSPAWPATLGG